MIAGLEIEPWPVVLPCVLHSGYEPITKKEEWLVGQHLARKTTGSMLPRPHGGTEDSRSWICHDINYQTTEKTTLVAISPKAI